MQPRVRCQPQPPKSLLARTLLADRCAGLNMHSVCCTRLAVLHQDHAWRGSALTGVRSARRRPGGGANTAASTRCTRSGLGRGPLCTQGSCDSTGLAPRAARPTQQSPAPGFFARRRPPRSGTRTAAAAQRLMRRTLAHRAGPCTDWQELQRLGSGPLAGARRTARLGRRAARSKALRREALGAPPAAGARQPRQRGRPGGARLVPRAQQRRRIGRRRRRVVHVLLDQDVCHLPRLALAERPAPARAALPRQPSLHAAFTRRFDHTCRWAGAEDGRSEEAVLFPTSLRAAGCRHTGPARYSKHSRPALVDSVTRKAARSAWAGRRAPGHLNANQVAYAAVVVLVVRHNLGVPLHPEVVLWQDHPALHGHHDRLLHLVRDDLPRVRWLLACKQVSKRRQRRGGGNQRRCRERGRRKERAQTAYA